MRRKLAGYTLILTLLLPLTLPAVAQAASASLAQLVELLRSDQPQAAYEVANQLLDAHAGEPQFDLYYGVAALRSDHPGQASFAFERVLMKQPGNAQARLGLAQALFAQQQDLRARVEFDAVLAQRPPAPVVGMIEQYLAAMDRRASRYHTAFSGYVELGAGDDSNANRAPSVSSIPLGAFVLILNDDQQEESAAFMRAAAGGQVDKPLIPGLNLVLGLDAETRNYQNLSSYNIATGAAHVGVRWNRGAQRLTTSVTGQKLGVAGDSYLNSVGLSSNYRYQLDKMLALHVDADVRQLRYDQLALLDSTLASLSLGIDRGWRGAWQPYLGLSFLVGKEMPKDGSQQAAALAERQLLGVDVTLALAPFANWTTQLQLGYRNSRYAESSFPFPDAKTNDYFSARLGAAWHINPHWQLTPYVSYEHNDSNIELYSFKRTQVGIDARYSFF